MKRTLLSLAILAAMSTSAMASGIGNTFNQPTANGGKGGEATATAGAAAVAGAAAKATVTSSNLNVVSANSNNSVAVHGDVEARNPVASAVATGLVASNGTCMGSTSAGAQGVTIGLSVGTTWTDESCDARFDAQSLVSLGQPTAALARLCQKAEIAKAIEASGQTCPGAAKAKADAKAAGYTGNDPYVLQRLAAK